MREGQRTQSLRKQKAVRSGGHCQERKVDLPLWQFGSHLHFSIADAAFPFGGDAGAHGWVDDSTGCGVAHRAARRQVRVGAARQVERVTVKDPIATDDIRRQRGKDVQFAIPNKRVVRRCCRHLEFTIPARHSKKD